MVEKQPGLLFPDLVFHKLPPLPAAQHPLQAPYDLAFAVLWRDLQAVVVGDGVLGLGGGNEGFSAKPGLPIIYAQHDWTTGLPDNATK